MANAQGQNRDNFLAYVTREGQLVPGSVRRGHNVITDYGKQWFKDLVGWALIGGVEDEDYTMARIRWMSIGTGWRPEVPGVLTLASPVKVGGGGLTGPYMDEISEFSWPVFTAYRVHHQFDGVDVGAISATEFGLHAGYRDGGGVYYPAGMDPTITTNPVIAYKQVDPIALLATETLHVYWELQF